MGTTAASAFPFPPKRIYLEVPVPLSVIRRYARAIAEEFSPQKIVLFGSYAYGKPRDGSDVDLLVIMPTGNPHAQAVRIQYRLTAPFPLDLVIRTPQQIHAGLAEAESFLTTVLSQGKVLYEENDAGLGQKGGIRLRPRNPGRRKRRSGA